MSLVRLHQIYSIKSTILKSTPLNESNFKTKTIILIGRDSHKSVYDGLKLSKCDGKLIPYDVDIDFQVTLSVSKSNIEAAIQKYGKEVYKRN